MNEVSKFISMEDSSVNETTSNGTIGSINNVNGGESTFKVCSNNLPAKPSFFTKLKNVLFYEIKVELTPYEQKIEDEINEFLNKKVTWEGVKNFLFQEISFTGKGKRNS